MLLPFLSILSVKRVFLAAFLYRLDWDILGTDCASLYKERAWFGVAIYILSAEKERVLVANGLESPLSMCSLRIKTGIQAIPHRILEYIFEFVYKPHAIYLLDHNLACLFRNPCALCSNFLSRVTPRDILLKRYPKCSQRRGERRECEIIR